METGTRPVSLLTVRLRLPRALVGERHRRARQDGAGRIEYGPGQTAERALSGD